MAEASRRPTAQSRLHFARPRLQVRGIQWRKWESLSYVVRDGLTTLKADSTIVFAKARIPRVGSYIQNVMKTLVVGGTGTVGSRVVGELLKRGSEVRVMTRSADKFPTLAAGVEGVVGDLQKPETLDAAFAGADAVFLATALAMDETHQGLNAVEAAKRAGLEYIVYLSVHKLESCSHIPHFASKLPVEWAVKNSGIPYTLVRPNNFYQNDLWFRDAIMEWGVYPQPLNNDVGVSRVDAQDIAEAVAISLTEPGHNGRTYSIVGPDPLTGEQTAQIYSRYLDREVRYTGDDLAAFKEQAGKMMPAWMVLDAAIMYEHFLKNGLRASDQEIADLTGLLGHAPRSFVDFVKEVSLDWRQPASS